MSLQNGKIRVMIAAKERGARDQLRQLTLAADGREIVGTATDGQEAVQLAVLLKPDIAVIDTDLPIYSGFEAAEMISLAAPEVHSVLIGQDKPDMRTLQKAMLCGVKVYLPSPPDAEELTTAIDRLRKAQSWCETEEFQTATDPSLLPQVIVVTGGKGGVGKSTTAASLAMCLAKDHPGRVVLFDLYTQFGDVATMVNVSPSKVLTDLTFVGDDIDSEMIEGCLAEHETGMKVLVSSRNALPIDAISVATAEAAIHALKRSYTYIIIDAPPMLHSTTLYVLSHAHTVLLITTLFDLPTLRDSKTFYDMVAGAYVPEDRIAIVANRVSKHDTLKNEDVKRIFGREPSAQIPNDHRLVRAMNHGVPFVRAYEKSPMSAAIEKIAAKVVERSPIA